MKNYKTLLLTKKEIERLVTMKEAIDVAEEAFRDYALGKAQMPPKVYLHLDHYQGDFRAMPAYVASSDSCILKWVNVHPRNKLIGLPTVMAVVILSDPQNGFPLCIMDGTYLTSLRTGAAGGIAAKYLARKDSHVVGLVGCGAQAQTQLLALRQLFDLKEVKVWGHKKPYVDRFIREMKKFKFPLQATESIERCVQNSDIVVTTTPSRRPLVKFPWLKKGAHINAMGADAKGKEELDPYILKNAKVVIDDWAQASHSGEINVPLRRKFISRRHIYAELGQIVAGQRKGRRDDNEITVFDSTGLAIQDAAMAHLIYKEAKRKKLGRWIKLVDA